MSFSFPETRTCERCGLEALVPLYFMSKSKPRVCKNCLTAQRRVARQKSTGADPKKQWGFFSFSGNKRKDPRDIIVQI